MVGEGAGMSLPAMLQRALAAGATSAAEPHDTSFGDHRAAFADSWGNQWWVATRIDPG